MRIKKLNKKCKDLAYQYGIVNPPELIPMKYSRTGKCAILGYYDHSDNTIAINKYAIEMWSIKSIVDVIKHELIHAKCYHEFNHGGHGEHFQMLCKMVGLDKETTRAVKTKVHI